MSTSARRRLMRDFKVSHLKHATYYLLLPHSDDSKAYMAYLLASHPT